jgi:membrane protein
MWVYFSWLTVLFGAIVTASLSHWRSTHSLRLDQAARLYYAVNILKLMQQGLSKGEVQTLPGLSRQLHIGYDDVERILDKLVEARIVGKLAGAGWSMVRLPEAVKLSELLKLFLLDVSTLPKRPGLVRGAGAAHERACGHDLAGDVDQARLAYCRISTFTL